MRFLNLICENDDFSDKYITDVVISYFDSNFNKKLGLWKENKLCHSDDIHQVAVASKLCVWKYAKIRISSDAIYIKWRDLITIHAKWKAWPNQARRRM